MKGRLVGRNDQVAKVGQAKLAVGMPSLVKKQNFSYR
jgi:hypothetical protein